MSGLSRNAMPALKKVNRTPLYLPEIVTERDVVSPGSFRLSADARNDKKFTLNSNVSSATSRRFQALSHRPDWPSMSDTESPKYVEIESSGSSGSSMFSWADPDATRCVAEEWEKIERTLYEEPGSKVTKKHLIDECEQWKSVFPHLRVIGKKCTIIKVDSDEFHNTEEEILATEYDSDVDNSNLRLKRNKKLLKERISTTNQKIYKRKQNTTDIIDELDKYLHISSIGNGVIHKESLAVENAPSIIRSEISSSRWKHKNASPDNVSFSYRNELSSKRKIDRTRESSVTSLSSLLSTKRNNVNGSHQYYPVSGYFKKSAHSMQNFEVLNGVSKAPCLRSISQDVRVQGNSGTKRKNISLPPLQMEDIIKKPQNNNTQNRVVHRKIKDVSKNINLSPINAKSNADSVPKSAIKKARNRRKDFIHSNLSPL